MFLKKKTERSFAQKFNFNHNTSTEEELHYYNNWYFFWVSPCKKFFILSHKFEMKNNFLSQNVDMEHKIGSNGENTSKLSQIS